MLWISLFVSICVGIVNLCLYLFNLCEYLYTIIALHGNYLGEFKVYGFRALICAIIALISFALLQAIKSKVKKTTKKSIRKLVSLKDFGYVAGMGNMFYMNVSTKLMYIYYYKHENGSYKQGIITSTDDAIIYMDNYHTPCIITYTTTSSNTPFERFLSFGSFEVKTKKYKIYVTNKMLNSI